MEQDDSQNLIFEDLAKGTLYGALCGDSFGSYLEFKHRVTPQEVDKALTMPGGGPFRLGKGQITDDGELALCLGHGLVGGNGALDLNKIAEYYKEWMDSDPFDRGMTISTAFYGIYDEEVNFAKGARKGASRSKRSQSNGGLMRITPMCIWSSELEKDELIKCVREETKLSHSNQTALDVSVVYVYTIQHLLKNKGDSEGAFQKAKEMAKYLNNSELRDWVDEAEKEKMPKANDQIGWVKIALCYSLYFLRRRTEYKDAMKEMIEKGGDTDTNCCIVGGMLGALHGYEKLPKDFVEAVRGFNPKKGSDGPKRPNFLVASECADDIIKNIIVMRPITKATIIGAEN